MFAVPRDLSACGRVQDKAVRRLVDGPHAAGHVITLAKLIREPVALVVQQQRAGTTQRFGGQKFDLGVGVGGVDDAGGVHLDGMRVVQPRTDAVRNNRGRNQREAMQRARTYRHRRRMTLRTPWPS